MPSTPSALLNLELQADGENLNAWGQKLNSLFSRVEEAVAGALAKTVDDDSATLGSADYVQNEHRNMMLVLSGAGGTLTIPATSKAYLVKNNCTDPVIFTHGSGATVTVAAGKIKWVATDGTDFFTAEEEDYLLLTGGVLTGLARYNDDKSGDFTDRSLVDKAYADTKLSKAGGTMTGDLILSGAPTADNEAATKAWVESVALGSVSVSFAWADVTGKPTTIAGYGITDAYTDTEVNALLAAKQPLDSDLTAVAALTTTERGRAELTRPSPREVTNSDSPVTADFGDTIFVDCSSGAVEIDLPAATANSLPITVIDDDGSSPTNQIVIDPDGSETINGQDSIEIDQARAAVTLIPFAGRWQIKK